ncbi:HD-GYP domain-containing protein [sulfur-oxidizing endosymbiont of Gigantopelta aegis]|uniref:HD-GYP domain-containing protein n=1 Tax=sulfur-oxidizing endosymbiont of Gigantopelta aegis TaxID=2794934 RepID=UPI001FE7BD5A|nr:HD domain-containing phosphohydrolase [sulfur-oxidizing endosymbiont of Gigantopelta aegis]
MLVLYLNQVFYLKQIELYNTANNEILSMNVDILQLRHAEKKYFVEQNSHYLAQHKKYLASFQQTLQRLISLAKRVKANNDDLPILQPLIKDYERRFYSYINNTAMALPEQRLTRYTELNFAADMIEESLTRMKQELTPHFDESLVQSKRTSTIIIVITGCILLLSILLIFRSLAQSFDKFLLFFKQAKTSYKHLDGKKFTYTEFKKMADMANEMIDARLIAQNQLKDLNENLEERVEAGIAEIKNLNHEIEETQSEVVLTMGAIGESRSKETGNHVKRVAEFSRILALEYGLKNSEAEMLKEVSPMHDIGKIAIPDSILNKPGKLTDEERAVMDTHTTQGYDMLKFSNKPLVKAAAIVAHEHHEKWDGSGYPRGLKGKDIHIFGRITAVVDVFDALASDRCYKKSWPDKKIIDFIKSQSGKHFDPELVSLFIANVDRFFSVRDQYKDVFE